jgi:hypothetical protein
MEFFGNPAQCLILLILSSSIANFKRPFIKMHADESAWLALMPIILFTKLSQ